MLSIFLRIGAYMVITFLALGAQASETNFRSRNGNELKFISCQVDGDLIFFRLEIGLDGKVTLNDGEETVVRLAQDGPYLITHDFGVIWLSDRKSISASSDGLDEYECHDVTREIEFIIDFELSREPGDGVGGQNLPRPQCEAGSRLEQINIPARLYLLDEGGRVVSLREVIAKPSLIYFGYTMCPDVCPIDVSRNAEAVQMLLDEDIDAQAIFISLDGERDNPNSIRSFVKNVDSRLIGLTGGKDQIDQAAKLFRVYYRSMRESSVDKEYYLVDHSNFTYLALPELDDVYAFRRDMTAEDLAEAVACYSSAYK